MLVYLNGSYIPREKAQVSVFDHGFLYGDGIYETMRAYNGQLFLLKKHLARLRQSANAIRLKLPLSLDAIAEALNETVRRNGLQEAYVRLHISRGVGEIGLDPALCPQPTMVIVAKQFHDYPATHYTQGVRVGIVATRRNHPLALPPTVKATNFLNNILAKIEAIDAGVYEAVMLNWKGDVAEGTISNIFMVADGVLRTPGIASGILAGVTRDLVLKLARRRRIAIDETPIKPKELKRADECFITNTTMEIMPVTMIDRQRIGDGVPGRITTLLHQAYRKEVVACSRMQASSHN